MDIANKIDSVMGTELVSIIIPIYNRTHFIRGAINSLLRQTYDNIEIIIIDDGSEINIENYVRAHCFSPKIKFFKKPHTGLSDTLNQGIINAKGDYLVFLDDDDFLASDMVEKSMRAMRQYMVDMVPVGYKYIKNNKVVKESKLPSHQKSSEELLKDLSSQNLFSINSVLVRKTIVEKAGGFNKDMPTNMDWDLWIRVVLGNPKTHFINEHLAFVRIHKANMSKDLIKMREGCLMVLENLEKSLSGQKRRELKIKSKIAKKIFILGLLELLFKQSKQNARKLFAQAGEKYIFYTLPSTIFLLLSLLPQFILNKTAKILEFYINKKNPYSIND